MRSLTSTVAPLLHQLRNHAQCVSCFGTGSPSLPPISTSLDIMLSAFDMQAQRTNTNTKRFDPKTNMDDVRSHTKRQLIQRTIGRLCLFGNLFQSPSIHPANVINTLNPSVWRVETRGATRTRWGDVLASLQKAGDNITGGF